MNISIIAALETQADPDFPKTTTLNTPSTP